MSNVLEHLPSRHRGFTLVEVLIVVVILGILAAVVAPQFSGATEDSAQGATLTEVKKIRRAIEVYLVRNENVLPDVTEGVGTWGSLVGNGNYLRAAPKNPYVGVGNEQVIVFGNIPDANYQTDHAWIYDPNTGDVWAGGFDGQDSPHPK